MKIILDYDGVTMSGPGGFTYAWSGLEAAEFKPEDYGTDTETLVKLAGLGYSADDINKMNTSGLL
jgi:hypothetical protein